jgi:hypothetical protein
MTDRNMARRVSFLIGLDGKLAHVTDTHLSKMKRAVERLEQALTSDSPQLHPAFNKQPQSQRAYESRTQTSRNKSPYSVSST